MQGGKKEKQKRRVVYVREREKKEREKKIYIYISSKSPCNLGIIFTITKVREGDIHHFIFLL